MSSENAIELDPIDHLPPRPQACDALGIGVIGAGFIVRDCHLVAYANAGYRVEAIASRSLDSARAVAELRNIPRVAASVDQLLDDPGVDIIDIAVPPAAQPALLERILNHQRLPKGILAQKPLALSYSEAARIVALAEARGVPLQVNQNMRYDQSVRALKALLDRGVLGRPILATIDMRAIPHWMPWARDGRSLSTFIMSIHHLDAFRYWLGEPERVLASTGPDPRTAFPHRDGLNLYILEFPGGARASSWDDVWTGPAREGSADAIAIRWRVEGDLGFACGTIGWPSWPVKTPSTIDYTCSADRGVWHRPRWKEAWFPDAFEGTMAGLMCAIEAGAPPDISGKQNLGTIALCEAVLAAALEHRVVEFAKFRETLEHQRGQP